MPLRRSISRLTRWEPIGHRIAVVSSVAVGAMALVLAGRA